VPWFWYVVNVLKDFFLRGGIAAIAGLICYDTFGRLPFVGGGRYANGGEGSQQVAWTLLNYGAIWVLLVVGGYQLAERVNTALCLLFTGCLMLCALAVLPRAVPELTRGLWPRLPRDEGEWLVLMALSGIVMSGSTTVYYSAWAEERRMGLYAFARRAGRRLTRDEFEPTSKEEAGQMRGWLRVNQLNVGVTYFLGALTCLSTFVLGVAILRPAGITLSDEEKLTTELSRMMTDVAGPWSKAVFYVGTYAAVISTAIGVLDGGSRVYLQPLKRFAPGVLAKLSTPVCHRIIMTLMVAGCWFVYVAVRDVLRLVLWMGAVDAPLVGVLVVTYAYMARWRLPRAYRQNLAITILMTCVGVAYFVFGTYYVCLQL
jgi:Mn2+/Fe2+ NRAMP family transporter